MGGQEVLVSFCLCTETAIQIRLTIDEVNFALRRPFLLPSSRQRSERVQICCLLLDVVNTLVKDQPMQCRYARTLVDVVIPSCVVDSSLPARWEGSKLVGMRQISGGTSSTGSSDGKRMMVGIWRQAHRAWVARAGGIVGEWVWGD